MKLLLLLALLSTSSTGIAAKYIAANVKHLQQVKELPLRALRSYVPLASRARWLRGQKTLKDYVSVDLVVDRPDLTFRRLEKGMLQMHAKNFAVFAPLLNMTEDQLRQQIELEKLINKASNLPADKLSQLHDARRTALLQAADRQQQARQWGQKSLSADALFRSMLSIERPDDLKAHEQFISSVVLKHFQTLQEFNPKETKPVLQEYLAALEFHHHTDVMMHWSSLVMHLEHIAKLAAEKKNNIHSLVEARRDKDFIKAFNALSEQVGKDNIPAVITSPTTQSVATMMRNARGTAKLRDYDSEKLSYNYLYYIESGQRLAGEKLLPHISATYGIKLEELRTAALIDKLIHMYDSALGNIPALRDAGEDVAKALATASAERKASRAHKSKPKKDFNKSAQVYSQLQQFERTFAAQLIQDMQAKDLTVASLSTLTGISADNLEHIIGKTTHYRLGKRNLRKITAVMGYDYEQELARLETEKLIGAYKYGRFITKDMPSDAIGRFEAAYARYQADKFLANLYLKDITAAEINAFDGVVNTLIAQSGKGLLDYDYHESLIHYDAQVSPSTAATTAKDLALYPDNVQRLVDVANAIVVFSRDADDIVPFLPDELNNALQLAIDRTKVKAPSNTLGALIRNTRERQGMSLHELADLASGDDLLVDEIAVILHAAESKVKRTLPFAYLPRVAKALNLSTRTLEQAYAHDKLAIASTKLERLIMYYHVHPDDLKTFVPRHKLRAQNKQPSARAFEINEVVKYYRHIVYNHTSKPFGISSEMLEALAAVSSTSSSAPHMNDR
ncbi:MAG: hypothetical protein OYH77_03490 [Pseudomonadota bacterium]|nr:hypothetical protein [Pseudomonadota bacterium]